MAYSNLEQESLNHRCEMNIKGEFSVPGYILKGKYYPNMSYDEVKEAYNGIGPAWFTPWIRKILDVLLSIFYYAIIIHDCDFTRGNIIEEMKEGNTRFLKNLFLCILFQLWYRPIKAIRFSIYAIVLYLLVRKCGAKAFWKNKSKVEFLP